MGQYSAARGAFTEEQWDALLDNQVHNVDLFEVPFAGGIAAFRSAVYREAEKRYGYAKTRRLDVSTMQVQSFGCDADFARRHKASPVPWRALDPGPAGPPPTPHPGVSDPASTRTRWPAPPPKPPEPPPAPDPYVWPAYGTWPPQPPGEEPRMFETEEELEAWEEEVEQLRLKAFAAAASEGIEPLTPEESEALLGPCTCGQDPVCLPECARSGR
jgi:hypothetical protein